MRLPLRFCFVAIFPHLIAILIGVFRGGGKYGFLFCLSPHTTKAKGISLNNLIPVSWKSTQIFIFFCANISTSVDFYFETVVSLGPGRRSPFVLKGHSSKAAGWTFQQMTMRGQSPSVKSDSENCIKIVPGTLYICSLMSAVVFTILGLFFWTHADRHEMAAKYSWFPSCRFQLLFIFYQ